MTGILEEEFKKKKNTSEEHINIMYSTGNFSFYFSHATSSIFFVPK
jgi:hypothetical protein